jgi:hypothetical protein
MVNHRYVWFSFAGGAPATINNAVMLSCLAPRAMLVGLAL